MIRHCQGTILIAVSFHRASHPEPSLRVYSRRAIIILVANSVELRAQCGPQPAIPWFRYIPFASPALALGGSGPEVKRKSNQKYKSRQISAPSVN